MLAFLMMFAFSPRAQAGASIADLPLLSKQIIHHYNCRSSLFLESPLGTNEILFQILPQQTGHDGTEYKFKLQNDEVTVSANAQLLQLSWTRSGQVVATALSMIQNSTTESFVLIAIDPADENNRADVNCQAVFYSNLGGGQK